MEKFYNLGGARSAHWIHKSGIDNDYIKALLQTKLSIDIVDEK